jgi:hypothetical protein
MKGYKSVSKEGKNYAPQSIATNFNRLGCKSLISANNNQHYMCPREERTTLPRA